MFNFFFNHVFSVDLPTLLPNRIKLLYLEEKMIISTDFGKQILLVEESWSGSVGSVHQSFFGF